MQYFVVQEFVSSHLNISFKTIFSVVTLAWVFGSIFGSIWSYRSGSSGSICWLSSGVRLLKGDRWSSGVPIVGDSTNLLKIYGKNTFKINLFYCSTKLSTNSIFLVLEKFFDFQYSPDAKWGPPVALWVFK